MSTKQALIVWIIILVLLAVLTNTHFKEESENFAEIVCTDRGYTTSVETITRDTLTLKSHTVVSCLKSIEESE